ncbi:hypothetical protein CRG98_036102 [Punica granatum]|uniref:Uncharacterized protein n=1 Tax=Punica granatum TaxID=22663 RepID=A0A2I0IIF7_PUNGR|nr:hypothetical protein CRG98_036102 [Punica granatum]
MGVGEVTVIGVGTIGVLDTWQEMRCGARTDNSSPLGKFIGPHSTGYRKAAMIGFTGALKRCVSPLLSFVIASLLASALQIFFFSPISDPQPLTLPLPSPASSFLPSNTDLQGLLKVDEDGVTTVLLSYVNGSKLRYYANAFNLYFHQKQETLSRDIEHIPYARTSFTYSRSKRNNLGFRGIWTVMREWA